ncbi:MAG: hypothetical protein WC346_04310 [Methanogenium sp.]|jgi:hypothetical protein
MKVKVKGTKIILSETPVRDVAGALFIIYYRQEHQQKDSVILLTKKGKTKSNLHQGFLDVHKGQKEYNLPEGVAKKDIEALYLRVL